MLNVEATELRLGLPGGKEAVKMNNVNGYGKRAFSDTVNVVDLKLNLSSSSSSSSSNINESSNLVHQLDNNNNIINNNNNNSNVATTPTHDDDSTNKPPAKAQVVGWPPVRSYRKNMLSVQKNPMAAGESSGGGAALVKVSVDGAPYLRKVDLKMYKSYPELSQALGKMFSSFTIGNCGTHVFKDFMNESKLIDLLNGSDYVPTYEDKDGDWMLVGDVPWNMFVESCKRLRIMKGSEAIGLAPRALEKCNKQKLNSSS